MKEDKLSKSEDVKLMITNSNSEYNLRGLLAKALHLLSEDLQRQLVLDYAEHVLWLAESRTEKDTRFRRAIDETREFLQGEKTISDIQRTRAEVTKSFHDFSIAHFSDLGNAIDTIRMAIGFCCHEHLKAAGYIARGVRREKAVNVAIAASSAIARHKAGSDWDAEDRELRKAARQRGHEASNEETKWQLERLLHVVEHKN